jgi:hypothetical protein
MAVATRLSGIRLAAARIGLPAWFVAIDLLWIAKPAVLGIDARHYQRAASVWLSGGDPWAVTESGVTFAASPHTLLFYAPTSLLPLDVAVGFWMVLGVAASAWTVRRLRLPLWWVLFPPLVQSAWNGNPQSVALALLVTGLPIAAIAAVGLKLYAGVPLLARPKVLVAAGIALLVTLPVLPWQLYIDTGFGVSDHITTAWNGGAWRFPVLVPPTLLALWVLRRRGAEWLAVPAVWPATQFYYVAMALPAIVNRPVLAALFALPAPLVVPLAVIVLGAWQAWSERQRSRGRPPLSDDAPLWLRRFAAWAR